MPSILEAHATAAALPRSDERSYVQGPEVFEALDIAAASIPGANRGYRLLRPVDNSVQPPGGWPVVVYLHGAGAKGSDNVQQLREPLVQALASAEGRAAFPCFVLAPQCRAGNDPPGRVNNWVNWEGAGAAAPSEWVRSGREPSDQLAGAMHALQEVLAREPIDPARILLAGVSMGASGVWWWAANEQDRFAGVLAVCGLSEVAKAAAVAHTPVWTFHGSDDPVVPVQRTRDMVAAVLGARGKVRFTEYPGAGHSIAERVMTEGDSAALRWLFAQRRKP